MTNKAYPAALQLFEDSAYRLTKPRRILLETIFRWKGPFSIPKLEKFLNASARHAGFDLVTIYRTLPLFEKLGIIEKCDFSEGVAHYEVVLHRPGHHQRHHHHHIVCKICKKIEPLDFCILDRQEKLLKKRGYKNLTHRLEFSAICPDCA